MLLLHGEEDALVATLKTLVREDALTTLLKDRALQGRRHADVAFDMALAGVGDAELFVLLASGARRELERCGARKSMRRGYCDSLRAIRRRRGA